MLFDIGLRNIFIDYVSLGKENKSKNKQMGLHQTKSFCTAKETFDKTRQPPIWEKIFANDISNKELISKINQECTQQQQKKTTQFIKWAEEMNRYFFQGKHRYGQQVHE